MALYIQCEKFHVHFCHDNDGELIVLCFTFKSIFLIFQGWMTHLFCLFVCFSIWNELKFCSGWFFFQNNYNNEKNPNLVGHLPNFVYCKSYWCWFYIQGLTRVFFFILLTFYFFLHYKMSITIFMSLMILCLYILKLYIWFVIIDFQL